MLQDMTKVSDKAVSGTPTKADTGRRQNRSEDHGKICWKAAAVKLVPKTELQMSVSLVTVLNQN